jgi:hypothetical protein
VTGLSVYFYKGDGDLFDWLIRKWTRSPYSHCAVVFTFEGGEQVLYEAQNGVGVVSRTVVADIDLRTSQWDHIDIPVSAASQEKVLDWCRGELGCKYDWRGMFWSQVLFIPREHPDKWFCSEYAAAALEQMWMLQGKKPCTFSPGSLERLLKDQL